MRHLLRDHTHIEIQRDCIKDIVCTILQYTGMLDVVNTTIVYPTIMLVETVISLHKKQSDSRDVPEVQRCVGVDSEME